MWIACCIFHACQLNYINWLWSEGKYTYKSADLAYIKFLRHWTDIRNAARRPSQTGSELAEMSADIDTLRDVWLWYVHLCLWAEAGQHDLPNWACFRFIVHKLGICHLWSAIKAHAEEVDSPSPPFHYSTLTHFGVRRRVKFNRGITPRAFPPRPSKTCFDPLNKRKNLIPSASWCQ